MNLPHELLEAVSATGGGRITLVVGAGCSFEAPTSLPLAEKCSQECHDRLVDNGVLAIGDCSKPWDLPSLADAVVAKKGEQRLLVEQLRQHYTLTTATPNEGHFLAAALLREGAITSILTLNFDLALTTAIGALGIGDRVGIINSPDDLAYQMTSNLYYLHRNAAAADPETWILSTAALMSEWKGNWESVVATKVLAAPVVVFAGLGSSAGVLIESMKLIQKAIPSGTRAYQVDPFDYDKSEFFKALSLDPSEFIQATWCEFMADLSQRLLIAHTSQLRMAAETIVARERLAPEDLTALLNRLLGIGLLKVGHLRASWLLHEKPYHPEELQVRERIADLLLAAALIARVTNTTAVLFEDGIVEFRRDHRTVATHVIVSGGGTRSRSAIEAELSMRRRRYRGSSSPPGGAIIAGTSDDGREATPPPDVLRGKASGNIVDGPSTLQMFHVAALRHDSGQCQKVAP